MTAGRALTSDDDVLLASLRIAEAFGFRPTDEIPFQTVIAEVTPDELAALRKKPEAFPRGWSLSRATRFERPGQG